MDQIHQVQLSHVWGSAGLSQCSLSLFNAVSFSSNLVWICFHGRVRVPREAQNWQSVTSITLDWPKQIRVPGQIQHCKRCGYREAIIGDTGFNVIILPLYKWSGIRIYIFAHCIHRKNGRVHKQVKMVTYGMGYIGTGARSISSYIILIFEPYECVLIHIKKKNVSSVAKDKILFKTSQLFLRSLIYFKKQI